MRTRIIIISLLVNAVLLGIFAYMPGATVQAQGGCPATYIVKRGDYLLLIARGYNTTLQELLRLNPRLWGRENWIYPGEVLCVPVQTPPPPTPTPGPTQYLALEAEFTVQPSPSMTLTLPISMTMIGKRKPLTLQANQGITVSTPFQIRSFLSAQSSPVLIAFGNGENDNGISRDFTLFAVDSPDILSSLRINPDQPLALTPGCAGQPLNEAFGAAVTQPVTLTAWLENTDGRRFAFPITKVGLVPASRIAECLGSSTSPAFVVLPANPPQPNIYRTVLRVGVPGGAGDLIRYVCEALGYYGQIICGAR